MASFSIIIPVFNHPGYTKLCLDSLVKSSAEIIVVDNASREQTKKLLESYGSRLVVISNDTNLGTGIAFNQGVLAASSERIMLLHNDCCMIDGFEDISNSCFQEIERKNIKLAVPLTNYCDEAIFVWSKELQDEFTSHKLYNKSRPTFEEIQNVLQKTYQRYGGLEKFSGQINKFPLLSPCLEVSSFCILTLKSVFNSIGGFSDKFKYRGSEDKELCSRYHQNGLSSGRAGFFVHHFGNITSDGPGFNCREMLEINNEIFSSLFYDGAYSWTAVVFPDKDPALTARIRSNLLDLNFPPKQIIEIPPEGIFPISKAWEWVLPQIEHDVFARLDADMLLRRDAVNDMLEPFKKNPKIVMTAAHLEDPCIGKIGSLVFWKTIAFKNIDHSQTPAMNYEAFYISEIEKAGLEKEWIPKILGDHAITLDPWIVFKAFFRRGIKQRIRGMGSKWAVAEISGAFKKDSPWSHLALLAFHLGLTVDYDQDPHDAAYEAFALPHYEKVKPFIQALVAGERPQTILSKQPDDRIRVALITDCLEIGGMEVVIKLIDELLDRTKINLFIYASVGGILEKDLKTENIRIVHISNRVNANLRKITCERMRNWLIHDKIDVAVNMAFWNASDIFANGKPCRIIERTDGKGFKYIEKPGLTDLVIYESDCMKRILPEFSCKNQVTITNGRKPFVRDLTARNRIRQQIGVADNDILIANIARLDEIKNQRHLILMAKELRDRGRKNFKVVIMGPDHYGIKAKLESLIAETKTENIVSIFDESTPSAEMLSAADVFTLPSLSEGLSGALVEAVVAGLPVVATDVGAASEIVKQNGILVPVEDLPALVDAMSKFLIDERRLQAGKLSLEIAKNYSAEKMVEQFEKVFLEQGTLNRKQESSPDKITIILPCRDQKKEFLEDAIKSVLAQTSPDWTLLVAIDSDTPEAIRQIVSNFNDNRIELVVSNGVPGAGVSAPINDAMQQAKTDFACILMSHDKFDAGAIATLKNNIRSYPEIDFFYSSRAYMNSKGIVQAPVMQSIENFSPDHFKKVGCPVKHLLCWRVQRGLAIGGMDTDLGLGGADDYDFPWMMYEAGCKFKAIKECLYYYRVHHQFHRLTVNIPIDEQYSILRRMFKKHHVSDEETESFIKNAKNYLVKDKQLNFEKDMTGVIGSIQFSEIKEDSKKEFLEAGRNGRHIFPHKTYALPKAGPDALLLSKRLCGISDPSKMLELVLYADESLSNKFPREVFFDKDVIWHQQHFNRPGQIATANLVLGHESVYGAGYVSDIYQRISRRRELKTQIEKKFMGWPYMLYNSILHFAAENKFKTFYSPTADKIIDDCIDKTRRTKRELYDTIYDNKLLECFEATKANGFWVIDVVKNANRVVKPERRNEIIEMGKTICICHDIEAGLGHENNNEMAKTAPDALREMLRIERESGVKATYNVVGQMLPSCKEVIEKDGHCIAFHSYNHVLEEDQLERCREVDYRIKGYRPPQSKITGELNDENLCYRNFEWLASAGICSGVMPEMRNGIVKIPILFDDFSLFNGMAYRQWEEKALIAIRENYFVAFSLHDCYAKFWLPHYSQFIGKIMNIGKLKTMDEVSAEVAFANAV